MYVDMWLSLTPPSSVKCPTCFPADGFFVISRGYGDIDISHDFNDNPDIKVLVRKRFCDTINHMYLVLSL